jgi:ABC-type phosphate transport system substrate-binding protein
MAMTHRITLVLLAAALALAGVAAQADVVAVVSAKSPITSLTRSQVMDIFLSRSTHFPDGSPAVPIDQHEGSATRDEFYNVYAAMSAAQIKAFWSRIIFTGRGQPPKAVANADEAKALVAANINTITYIDRNRVDTSVKIVLVP